MEMGFKSKRIDNFVSNLKSTFFDVMTLKQRNMDIIEGLIGSVQGEEQEMELQQLWADYHQAEKSCLLSANRMIKAMEEMDACFQSYYEKVYQKGRANVKEAVNEAPNQQMTSDNMIPESEVISAEPEKEKTAEAVAEATVAEATVAEAPVVEEPVAEAAPSESVLPVIPEGETEAVAEAPVSEAAPSEGVLPVIPEGETEAVAEAPVAEAAPSEGVLPVIPEEKTEAVAEAPVAEAAPSEEVLPVIPEGETEAVAEAPVVEAPIVEAAPSEGVLPVIPEEKTEAVAEAPVAEVAPSEGILPVISEGETVNSEQSTVEGGQTFQRDSVVDPKAIIVNASQKDKLSASLPQQKELVETAPKVEGESEQKVEQLMNQLSSLYEQGNVAEAEKVSEQIRVYSKALTPTV